MADDTDPNAPLPPDQGTPTPPDPAPVETPAPDTTEPPAVDPAALPVDPAVPPVEAKPDGRQTPWYMKRLGEQGERIRTQDEAIRAKDAENEALKRAFAALNQGALPTPMPTPAPQPTPAGTPRSVVVGSPEYLAEIAAEAIRVAAAKSFTEQCNASYEAGQKAHPDFKDAVDTLNAAGAMSDQLVEAVLETGIGHEVLYKLGKDPDQAMRLSKLPPVKLAMEIAKIAGEMQKAPAPKPQSRAPAPVPDVGGTARGGFDVADTQSALNDWIASRNKQAKERAEARR